MWALRRVSLPLRSRGLSIRSFTAACPDFDQQAQVQDRVLEFPRMASDKCPCFKGLYCSKHVSSNLNLGRRYFSSRAGAKRRGVKEEEDDSDGAVSNTGAIENSKAIQGNESQESEDDLTSNIDSEDDYDDGDAEADLIDKAPSRETPTGLVGAIIVTNGLTIKDSLQKWADKGNALGRAEIYSAMLSLRKLRMFGRALLFSEWLEETKRIEFSERDYSSRLDFIAKVHGLYKAESYIEKIPESFRGEVVYRTLLANCVRADQLKKAEEVFNKMRDLEFPLTTFTCNQLLLLYKRVDNKKIADVLLLMEKENLKPTLFTYKMLIETKGRTHDIKGMEAILETMKNEGLDQDTYIKSMVAGYYASAGLKEKAVALLKEIEGGNLKENRYFRYKLLEVYAELGQADEVCRIWKLCEKKPKVRECLAVIGALGKLKKINEAEAVFEKLLKIVRRPLTSHYNSLLKVYADNNMFAEGKDLIKQMMSSGCKIDALTWDSLVKLFVDAGDLEKANAVLLKASKMNLSKPILFRSYMTIMDEYSKKGDIHNTEKMFLRMRQAGYTPRHNQFQALIQAYINAKAPAYGMRERMKEASIFPNKVMAAKLIQIDAFRKSEFSEFLD